MNETRPKQSNFIRDIVDADLESGKHLNIITRFPPEPNGYLHIGHAKSICLNFDTAEEKGGECHLRFDDTNPEKEEEEFIEAIKADVAWLGYSWGEHLYHASNYFDQLYQFAVELIQNGKAYVEDLTAEEIRTYRGTLTTPGKESPCRERSIEDNLDLFERMRAGEFGNGEHVLRARIDMSSPNLNMRDPVLYRIRHATHPMTGDRWSIYPMYDFTHSLSDAIEGITHSLCTLEFQDHRPLYDWCIENVSAPSRPRQIEFSRLNLEYTVMSKRLLTQLVDQQQVEGWDDPRLPTLVGLRRRGFTPESIRLFINRVGVTKKDHTIQMSLLENSAREVLDQTTPRRLAVLDPIKVIIDNYPDGQSELLDAINHPNFPERGSRKIPFSKEIWIERADFMEEAPKKFFRLSPGREVRLRFAYLITCKEITKDSEGKIVTIHCDHDPASRGGNAPDGRKVKGTIHWVCAQHAVEATVRLYDRLFQVAHPLADPAEGFGQRLNPDSLKIIRNCKLEPGLEESVPESRFQFERLGYFCSDRHDHSPEHPVFNRIVPLRDSWSKIEKATPVKKK